MAVRQQFDFRCLRHLDAGEAQPPITTGIWTAYGAIMHNRDKQQIEGQSTIDGGVCVHERFHSSQLIVHPKWLSTLPGKA